MVISSSVKSDPEHWTVQRRMLCCRRCTMWVPKQRPAATLSPGATNNLQNKQNNSAWEIHEDESKSARANLKGELPQEPAQDQPLFGLYGIFAIAIQLLGRTSSHAGAQEPLAHHRVRET